MAGSSTFLRSRGSEAIVSHQKNFDSNKLYGGSQPNEVISIAAVSNTLSAKSKSYSSKLSLQIASAITTRTKHPPCFASSAREQVVPSVGPGTP